MRYFCKRYLLWSLLIAVPLIVVIAPRISGVPEVGQDGLIDDTNTEIAVSGIDDRVEIPDGMVHVAGGQTQIGSEEGKHSERPVFTAEVDAFLMDEHPVTVSQFRAFVEETEYVTEAEEFGNAGVLDPNTGQWHMVEGATWEYPMGAHAEAAPEDHPVTQVSWNDATAYAEWSGKRLPTEVEWEHAARNAGESSSQYSWGDRLVEEGEHRANTWQGQFPVRNTGEDGYYYTSPVGIFGETELGLTDMGGNVWEWTADWYRPYATREESYTPRSGSQRAQRGGSFLCHESYCHGFRVSARSHSTPETALFHVGFRGVKDVR